MMMIGGRDSSGWMQMVVDDDYVACVECKVVANDVGNITFLGGINHSVEACHFTIVRTAEGFGGENMLEPSSLAPLFIQRLVGCI